MSVHQKDREDRPKVHLPGLKGFSRNANFGCAKRIYFGIQISLFLDSGSR
jgi:hypothetical protein